MKAKIIGAAILGALAGGVGISGVELVKTASAQVDGYRFVNTVTTIDQHNIVYARQEDPESKAICYTAFRRNGNIVGFSCIKKD